MGRFLHRPRRRCLSSLIINRVFFDEYILVCFIILEETRPSIFVGKLI